MIVSYLINLLCDQLPFLTVMSVVNPLLYIAVIAAVCISNLDNTLTAGRLCINTIASVRIFYKLVKLGTAVGIFVNSDVCPICTAVARNIQKKCPAVSQTGVNIVISFSVRNKFPGIICFCFGSRVLDDICTIYRFRTADIHIQTAVYVFQHICFAGINAACGIGVIA